VSCPYCFDKVTPAQRERFAEREKQIQLAKQRGDVHMGSDALDSSAQRRAAKQAERQRQRALSAQ